MPKTEPWTNPEVLRWARERLNLTIEQVVEEAKKLRKRHFTPVSASELRAWEAGTEAPELAHLETLAEIYACPVGWFFLETPPTENLSVSFRGLAKPREDLTPLSQRTLRHFIEQARWTVEMLRKSGQPWPVSLRPMEVLPDISRTDELAARYRQRLGWTPEQRQQLAGKYKEAFDWWRRTIESLGVFCFEMPLDPTETRGAALWLEGYPFILVNHRNHEAAAGRIFTLLHEFAHLISAEESVVCDFHGTAHDHNPEPFANRLAARILVTPEELRQCLREIGEDSPRSDWSDTLLDKLRSPFCASRDVIAILLQEIGFAPSGFYERKRQEWLSRKLWGRGGKRPRLNEQKLQQVGYSLTTLLVRSAEEPSFSWLEAASILGTKVEKAEAFIRWARTHLQ